MIELRNVNFQSVDILAGGEDNIMCDMASVMALRSQENNHVFTLNHINWGEPAISRRRV